MPFTIIRQDITKMHVDAIVNAANTNLQMGGGVCGVIFEAAGKKQLQAACDKLAPINTGEAVITPGFNLPAKYVIHAAGPVFRDEAGDQNNERLRAAYLSSLDVAMKNDCESIAFPLISSGIYGFPKDVALKVARSAILEFLELHDMHVTLVVFDKSSFVISRELHGDMESFIDTRYASRHRMMRQPQLGNPPPGASITRDQTPHQFNQAYPDDKTDISFSMPVPLKEVVGNLDESFSQTLFRLIDARGMTDVEVYKRANLDRKLFSKIRINKGYMPSKRTAVALAIALKLTFSETEDLLSKAGYALSRAVLFDALINYFITIGKYDIYDINEVLFEYDQPLLGG